MTPLEEALEIYNVFAATTHGRHLASMPRYGRFVPPGQPVKWLEDLIGDNANSLYHMDAAARGMARFVERENALNPGSISLDEARLVVTSEAIHDQGEAIVGDIPYGRKTEEQRRAEETALWEYEAEFAPGLSRHELELYRGAREIVWGDRSEKLPGLVDASHLIGFMDDTLTALRHVDYLKRLDAPEVDRQEMRSMERLAIEVLGSTVIKKLMGYAERFPAAYEYLRENADEIVRGYRIASATTFDWYDTAEDPGAAPGEADRRFEKFLDARYRFEGWARLHSLLPVAV